MAHDFKKFPELTNAQMNFYYFESPHKQITENFTAKVIRVIDWGTIRVTCNFRKFSFPIRFINIFAAELNEKGGIESKKWLERQILNRKVDVDVDYFKRVDKWGRLLGRIYYKGIDIGELSIQSGKSIGPDEERGDVEELLLLLENKLGNKS